MKRARPPGSAAAMLARDAAGWDNDRERRWVVKSVPRSRGLDEDESEGLDAAYLATLQRDLGQERLEEAHRRWLQTLVEARATVRESRR